ncbi:hypothetical protein BH20ACT12_BH20ACT12_02320 [soil metagenome]
MAEPGSATTREPPRRAAEAFGARGRRAELERLPRMAPRAPRPPWRRCGGGAHPATGPPRRALRGRRRAAPRRPEDPSPCARPRARKTPGTSRPRSGCRPTPALSCARRRCPPRTGPSTALPPAATRPRGRLPRNPAVPLSPGDPKKSPRRIGAATPAKGVRSRPAGASACRGALWGASRKAPKAGVYPGRECRSGVPRRLYAPLRPLCRSAPESRASSRVRPPRGNASRAPRRRPARRSGSRTRRAWQLP